MKLSAEEIGYIALFEKITGATAKDCVTDEEENKILFVVKKGDMGLAIGKKGANIQRVRQVIGKKIQVVEYSEDPAEFVKNIFHPFRVSNVSISNKVARVDLDDRDKIAMGRKNIQKAKMLAERHHNLSIVIV
ncbi:MAG: NusA-like transcription termination signal-binding factor [Candidatus Hydrothermarchaeota archaeon]|nr:NusA-like transcription termination signal-binding factor [Candidatus Hydrothermarchaeota archaeon]